MQTYVGVKVVEAEPQEKDGKPGYAVKYEDGYTSWSPQEAFERAYFPLADKTGRKVSQADVDAFVGGVAAADLPDGKTTLVTATTPSGFVLHEVPSCVDPANYDRLIGRKIGVGRIKEKLWGHLGFVLQWALYGLKR